MKRKYSRRTFLKLTLAGTAALLSAGALATVAPRAEGRLRLLNTHTGDRVDALYRDASGAYRQDGLDALNHVLRCHYTNEMTHMDPAVIEYLNAVDQTFGAGNEIEIISGYRSPRYNELLRSRSEGVAKHSLHLVGRAVDVRIHGVELDRLRRAAMKLRAGGVGFYPRSNFVHLDSGRVRAW